MPTWKIPPLLHPPLLLHPPPLDTLPLINPPGTKIGSVMMSSIPLNATMMVVIVVSKGWRIGMTSVLIANAWVWIVARKSKRLGEMAKGVMENGTMLDVSMMEGIAASGQIAKSAKMNLLFSKLQLNNEHIDL